MKLPKTLATWCATLFFLLAGLLYLGVSFPFAEVITGVVGIGAAVFTFINK